MRRYQFKLESVRRVRRLEEDLARGAVAAARVVERAAADRVAERLEACAASRTAPGILTGGQLRSALALIEHRVAAARAAADTLDGARVDVAARLGDWEASHQRVGVLDRLDERLFAEHQLEASRAETNEVDDIVSARMARAVGVRS